MRLVFFGPEGSGKTTQAKKISQKWRLPYISTGDLIRQLAKEDQGGLGQACFEILHKGIYLSDRLAGEIVVNRLGQSDCQSGFVLDGYPRTVEQAQFLDQWLGQVHHCLDKAILLTVSRETARNRVLARKRDQHDTPEKLASRLNQYYSQETGLVRYYREKNQLLTISGEASAEQVFINLKRALTI
jgi:adenylate kinase